MQPRKRFEVQLPSRRLILGEKTLIMGVLNVTPDSFYDGGRYFRFHDAVSRGLRMEEEGADIVDIGGESTRPGFSGVLPAAAEIRRIVPVIEELRKRLKVPVSVDTFKAEVAKAALTAGAEIVNDIGGLRLDARLAAVVATANAALVLMHSRGRPEQMHGLPRVNNVSRTVSQGLRRSVRRALLAGIRKQRLIIDPGIGFGKSAEDNLILLRKLDSLRQLGLPILIGASRKSFLGKILNVPVKQRLVGSLACCAVAAVGGVHVIRVHDVRETAQVLRVCDAIRNSRVKNS
jgi:dihydropteroate synthase